MAEIFTFLNFDKKGLKLKILETYKRVIEVEEDLTISRFFYLEVFMHELLIQKKI